MLVVVDTSMSASDCIDFFFSILKTDISHDKLSNKRCIKNISQMWAAYQD